MAASYPGAVKTFSAVVNGVTKLVAALFNSPYEEVTAIETELGINVAGSAADLVARLTVFLNDDGTSKVDVDDYGTSATTPTAKTLENVKICYGELQFTVNASLSVTNLPFTSSTSYQVVMQNEGSTYTSNDPGVVCDSGAQFTATTGEEADDYKWVAIGT